jgi:hypothetical protein
MSDSDAGTVIAKAHERKRKAHDLRNEAHTLMARAAITGDAGVRDDVQALLVQARNFEREADDLLSESTTPLASRGAHGRV